MSKGLSPTVVSEELSSVEIEVSHKIMSEMRRLIIAYQALFRDLPKAIAVNPNDWLQIGLLSIRRLESFDSRGEIKVDGVRVACKLNGPPELIASEEHVKHIEYLRQHDSEKLFPLLLGA